jgi:hypothetical protein
VFSAAGIHLSSIPVRLTAPSSIILDAAGDIFTCEEVIKNGVHEVLWSHLRTDGTLLFECRESAKDIAGACIALDRRVGDGTSQGKIYVYGHRSDRNKRAIRVFTSF